MFKRYALVAIELVRPVDNKLAVVNPETQKTAMDEAGKLVAFDYDSANFVYFRCRAISADVPNGNGDMFPEKELKAAYKTFIGVGMYKDHDSDSVDKSVGKVLWAEWVPEGKYVECYCCVDKMLAPELARRIEMGEASTVSMGCMVGEAECSVPGCGNIAHNAMELCEHMVPGRGMKGKRNHEGKVAYEINRLLQFTELSLVTVPADPTAKIFEVYAAHKAGKISDEELRTIIAGEMNSMLAALTTPPQKSSTSVSPTVITTQNMAPPVIVEATKASAPAEVVVRNKDSQQEERMKLAIQYQRGPALTSSFFVAKEADAEYRVCAADVLPLLVQEAITANEPGVATPEQIITDLSAKCATLGDFKVWAKKRKKKNRRAHDKAKGLSKDEGHKPGDAEFKHEQKNEHFMKNEKEADVAAAPAMTMPAAPAPGAAASPMDMPPASPDLATDDSSAGGDAHTNPADGGPAGEASVEELQQAIQEMQNLLKNKMSSAKTPAKVATKAESPTEHRDKGEEAGKPSPAKDPKADQEVKSTENPKGHMDKGAAMNKTAINEDWSMNPKELEKTPKQPKPDQAAPAVVSWEHKEMQSEEVSHDKGGDNAAGGKIKKFFGRLPSGGAGDAPKSMDLKSGVEENVMLKKALEAEKAKRIALETKESTAALVDKIADIITTLSEKNLITAEKEEETIKLLSGWKDLAILDGVHSLVSSLAVRQAEDAAPAGAAEVMVGNDAPQVFESVSNSDDAITMMSKIWNA